MRVAIVGGGISGLATAFYLANDSSRQTQVTLLESTHRWGGLLRTERDGAWIYECGPDSFVASKPEALRLCQRLGLESDLIASPADQAGAWVAYAGGLHRFPPGLITRVPLDTRLLLNSPLLSESGRRRLEREPLVPAGASPDESVAQFVRRRLGEEVLDRFVQPLMAGVYGGDAERLSIRSCLPRLYERERRCGHVTGESATPSGDTSGTGFLTLRHGMQQLAETLTHAMRGSVRLRTGWRARTLRQGSGRGFDLIGENGDTLPADSVVLAAPTYACARLLDADSPELAGLLREIRYAPCVIAALAFDGDVTAGRRGTGLLVPPSQGSSLFACTWVHQKFAGRCPAGTSLLRAFMGGKAAKEALIQPDRWVEQQVVADLARLLRIQQLPRDFRIYRWGQGLPQYEPGHWQRVQHIERALNQIPGLYLVGNYVDGVGISDCIRHAKAAAGQIASKR